MTFTPTPVHAADTAETATLLHATLRLRQILSVTVDGDSLIIAHSPAGMPQGVRRLRLTPTGRGRIITDMEGP